MRLRKNMKRAAAAALALSVALSGGSPERHWQRIIISMTVIFAG